MNHHLEAIRAGLVTRTNVIGLRKALNADWRRAAGWSVSQVAPLLRGEELDQIITELKDRRPRVDDDLFASGAARLRDRRYRDRWTRGEADIIADLACFRLVRFEQFNRVFCPVYQAVGTGGGTFLFYCPSWQSGGDGPSIVES